MPSVPSARSQLAAIRSGFILQGTTFKAWCRSAGIDPGYAHHVAAGRTNGPNAQKLRDRIVRASGTKAV